MSNHDDMSQYLDLGNAAPRIRALRSELSTQAQCNARIDVLQAKRDAAMDVVRALDIRINDTRRVRNLIRCEEDAIREAAEERAAQHERDRKAAAKKEVKAVEKGLTPSAKDMARARLISAAENLIEMDMLDEKTFKSWALLDNDSFKAQLDAVKAKVMARMRSVTS